MTFTLTALRTDVAAALRDSAAAIWSTAQLDLAIGQARRDYEGAAPNPGNATLTGISSRSIDISAAAPGGLGATVYAALIRVLAAEYPTGQWPPSYTRFDLIGSTLVLHSDAVPTAASVKLFYETTHTLDGASGTIADRDRQLLLAGSIVYAIQQYRREVTGTVNTNPDLSRQLDALATNHLAEWRHGLRALRRRASSLLYRPVEAGLQRDVVQFPD